MEILSSWIEKDPKNRSFHLDSNLNSFLITLNKGNKSHRVAILYSAIQSCTFNLVETTIKFMLLEIDKD